MPIEPTLLESANRWYDISRHWLIYAAVLIAIGAIATGIFLYVQAWSSGVRERYSEGRTAELELQTAEAKRDNARAQERIAELDKETAEANRRAKEAELSLARFRAPRLPTLEQLASITKKLKPFAGTKFDTGLSPDDREQQDFLWRLEPAITEAGWMEVEWSSPFGQVLVRGNRPKSGPAAVIGVSIEIHPEQRDRFLPAARALASALNDIGIQATAGEFNVHNNNPNAIHVLIGRKP